jgi:dihydroneopterin aldolase
MSDEADDSGVVMPGVRPPRRVFVRDLELMASVGIFEVEKRYEQRIVVGVELDVVDDYDGLAEKLDAVVDYGRIVASVRQIIDGRHFQLIETLAERIAEACLVDRRVLKAQITVEKPDILPGCRSVGITIMRQRASGT